MALMAEIMNKFLFSRHFHDEVDNEVTDRSGLDFSGSWSFLSYVLPSSGKCLFQSLKQLQFLEYQPQLLNYPFSRKKTLKVKKVKVAVRQYPPHNAKPTLLVHCLY